MTNSTESERKAIYGDLCRALNMDKETEENGWQTFQNVYQKTNMEGDPLEWFCCALYSSCRESHTPTVGSTNAVVQGNCVSLNKLLRCCNMSIYQFINKIKMWIEMAKLPPHFQAQTNRLEENLKITLVLFKQYNEIFVQLFQSPRNEKKNTKYRSVARCSSSKLFEMIWCLYLCAKNENPYGINADMNLVTSFHLLICCIDFVYLSVLAENRSDLINPKFSGVPPKWGTKEFEPSTISKDCIIEPLCRLTNALLDDTKKMKESAWQVIIHKFFETKILHGNAEKFTDVLSNANFERNLKSMNSSYEQYVLSVGEFDERILLNNATLYRKDLSESKVDHHQDFQTASQATPLTGKGLLPPRDPVYEPVAVATNNVKKLQNLPLLTEPTDFIRQAGEDVVKKITDTLSAMQKQFDDKFPSKGDAESRFRMAKSIYFNLLERITSSEIRNKPNVDLKVLLNTEQFNHTLIACCVEIVLFAYTHQVNFPWVLECLNLTAFNFFKIIEIVVRHQDGILTRELIMHLRRIEETCLESLVWKESSALWDILENTPSPLPAWSEVDVQNISIRLESHTQSPMKSALDTFNGNTPSDSARRDLFNTPKDTKRKLNDGQKRAGSLEIFLRKFYKMAWLRIKNLCNELDMNNELILKCIWNLFEHCISSHTHLMKDRHVDQIIMCSIYVYIKVTEVKDKSFQDIMKCYRKQPQSNSSIYREVKMEPTDNKNGETQRESSDIITFYNKIYVPLITPFALNFSEKKIPQHDLKLSPHPTERPNFPRKVSNHHLLYVYPLDKSELVLSPNNLTYEFSKSPAKDLDRINEIVRKRPLQFADDSGSPKLKAYSHYKAISQIMEDRKKEGH